jgi:hypothetical protein
MTNDTALLFLQLGATLHGVQLPATALLARGLKSSDFLTTLPPVARAVLAVLAGGVILAVLAGAVSMWLLPAKALQEPYVRAQVAGWTLFWGYRLVVQLHIYAPLVPARYRFVHWLLVGLFAAKTCCFAVAAWAVWPWPVILG